MSFKKTRTKLKLLAKFKGVNVRILKCQYCSYRLNKCYGWENRGKHGPATQLRNWGRFVCEEYEYDKKSQER